jgi:proteasome lid subunit RPN8/RPN11
MDEICLAASQIKEMIAQAAALYPEEACGLVAGRHGRAVRLYPIENVRHSPVAYEMDPLQQIRAMLALENEGLELLAIYHSHPDGPPRPSATDVTQAYYPDSAHLIISLANRERPAVRAFRIADGLVTEIAIMET